MSHYQLIHPDSIAGTRLLRADVGPAPANGAVHTYTMENSFLFHNYDIVSAQTVALGHGVTARVLNCSDTSCYGRWLSLPWTCPVRVAGTTADERTELTDPLRADPLAAPRLRPPDGQSRTWY